MRTVFSLFVSSYDCVFVFIKALLLFLFSRGTFFVFRLVQVEQALGDRDMAGPGFPFTSVSLDISPTFWDNFLVWGKYQKRFFKTTLDISLRFHHATIDGQRAAMFFNELQKQFNTINV